MTRATGAAESSGLVTLGSLAPAIELFGYAALVLNVLVGLFSDESSNWLSGRLFDLDFQGYRKRAITCEAAHLLLAYLCGLPLEEYSRKHVGYPLKPRPTGPCLPSCPPAPTRASTQAPHPHVRAHLRT
jgi:hypothetical protein